MVDTRELRIGNWVIYDKAWMLIESIDDDMLDGDISGIKITPEVLIKAGFSNEIEETLPPDSDFLTFFRDNISVEIIPDKMGLGDRFSVTIYEDQVDEDGQLASQGVYSVDYERLNLHTLQNFYFAINQTELTLTP